MGILSFLSGNYKPKDFANKTLEQIFKEIKLDKVDKSIQQNEEYAALPEETKSAIQMLIDLKEGKNIIYDKCYKGKGAHNGPAMHAPAPRPASFHAAVPASLPRQMQKPLSFSKKPAPGPAPAVEKASEDEEEEEKEEGQSGGGRRKKSRKSKRSGTKKSRRTKPTKKSRRSHKRK